VSREADFMQNWQQRLVIERGGTGGHTYCDLVQAVREAHEGVDPTKRGYYEVRTVRAVVLGAVGFESLCEDALNGQGLEFAGPLPCRAGPDFLPAMPEGFDKQTADYVVAFHGRTATEQTGPPSPQATNFGFYEGAYAEFVDQYWEERIASNDLGVHSPEELQEVWEASRVFGNVVAGLFADSVEASLDLLLAFGGGLCLAKRRPCGAEELSEYFADNMDVVTGLASVTREQRKGPKAALPFYYGSNVLNGDSQALAQQYVRAIKEDGGYRAQWRHTSLRNGRWRRPGFCPASDYSPLSPRTDHEHKAIGALLAPLGLEGLVSPDGRITAAELVIAQGLGIAQNTIYQQTEWQERMLAAHA
jgi:hypothetical protein